jgi:hypothetical protein
MRKELAPKRSSDDAAEEYMVLDWGERKRKEKIQSTPPPQPMLLMRR